MCGLAGLFALGAAPGHAPIRLSVVAEMVARLRHRGPDDGGLIGCDPGGHQLFLGEQRLAKVGGATAALGAMGHRRLSILDLQHGRQPVVDATGRYALVYNGELYNFRRLRRELEQQGVAFTGSGDTEVLFQALMRWGVGALPRFEGMFAFALWDRRERRLLLGRDRFGIKPLYYLHDAGRLAFASEPKALLAVPGYRPAVDHEALRDFLAYRYVPSPRTIFAQIVSLPPGHTLTVDLEPGPGAATPVARAWWQPDYSTQRDLSLEDAAHELDTLLGEVCRDHLVSDVPLGVFLSGGLDSSAILAHSQEQSDQPLQAMSVGFSGLEQSAYNELDAAREIAAHLGSRLHEVELDQAVLGVLPDVVAALDEPMADPSALPVFQMTRAARELCTVMLSGDGGDEVFGGYNRYRKTLDESRRGGLRGLQWGLLRLLGRQDTARMQRYLRRLEVMGPGQVRRLMRTEATPAAPFVPLDGRFAVPRDRDALTQWQALDLQTYLVDDNLKKTDRMSMASGLEVRVPLLDHRIVEFGLALPRRLRMGPRHSKLVLRESLRARLPEGILERDKLGFKVPLSAWMRDDDADSPMGLAMQPGEPIWSLLHHDVAEGWFRQHRSGGGNHTSELYSLLVLNTWLRQQGLP